MISCTLHTALLSMGTTCGVIIQYFNQDLETGISSDLPQTFLVLHALIQGCAQSRCECGTILQRLSHYNFQVTINQNMNTSIIARTRPCCLVLVSCCLLITVPTPLFLSPYSSSQAANLFLYNFVTPRVL